jgi:hypothetical protein
MKRTIFGLATLLVVCLTVFAVLVVHPVRKVKAHSGCSNRTLIGDYGWTEFGLEPEMGGNYWTQSGLVHFDGEGKFSGSNMYFIENGTPDPENPSIDTNGIYTVNSNCTVTISYDWEGETYTDHGAVVGRDGSEVITSEYSNKNDTTGHVSMKKIEDLDEH